MSLDMLTILGVSWGQTFFIPCCLKNIRLKYFKESPKSKAARNRHIEASGGSEMSQLIKICFYQSFSERA